MTTMTTDDFTARQEHIRRLTGQMLEQYRRETLSKVNDPDRLHETYGTHFMDADNRAQSERVCGLAASMLRAPFSQVNVITERGQETVAFYGNDTGPLELHDSFCHHVIGTGQPLSVGAASEHALVCDTAVARNGMVTSYLGVPIANRSGYIVGVLCVYDTKRREWDLADVTMLTQLAFVLTRAIPELH